MLWSPSAPVSHFLNFQGDVVTLEGVQMGQELGEGAITAFGEVLRHREYPV